MEKSELVCDGIYVNIDMIRKNLGILHNDERRMLMCFIQTYMSAIEFLILYCILHDDSFYELFFTFSPVRWGILVPMFVRENPLSKSSTDGNNPKLDRTCFSNRLAALTTGKILVWIH